MVNKQGEANMSERQPILDGIPATASDWQLYSTELGAEEAARHIAQTLSDSIREHFTPAIAFDKRARGIAATQVFNDTYAVIEQYGDLGSLDGECRSLLSQLVEQVFRVDVWARRW
jgi:hypothetical protein